MQRMMGGNGIVHDRKLGCFIQDRLLFSSNFNKKVFSPKYHVGIR
jgi:hypothetical protein